MRKNLVIVPCGDNSLHSNWLNENQDFDLALIYYGDSDEMFQKYQENAKFSIRQKGQKWHLIHFLITKYEKELKDYEYFWFPDDDLDADYKKINVLFALNNDFKLSLSQPSLEGYVSFDIERKVENSILRFTNFVEIICPVMDNNTLFKLLETFILNQSGWGLDFLWPKLLNYPTNKIAIIDEVTVTHTKPIAGDYSRFTVKPIDELNHLFKRYNLTWSQQILSTIQKW
jgi:hypothetical protein